MEQERLLMLLKSQRDELDDLIKEIGGARYCVELFNAETVNDMIHSQFDDVLGCICKGEIDEAIEVAERGMKIEWLKTS